MRKKIVAGNWKMNLLRDEALSLHNGVSSALSNPLCDVYHFAPTIYLADLIDSKSATIKTGAQNGYDKPNGAFTGEVSINQLKNLGVSAILVGHSERRQLFGESHKMLKLKVDAAIGEDLTAFFCCGETLDQRERGEHEKVVINQLKESLFHLSSSLSHSHYQ